MYICAHDWGCEWRGLGHKMYETTISNGRFEGGCGGAQMVFTTTQHNMACHLVKRRPDERRLLGVAAERQDAEFM